MPWQYILKLTPLNTTDAVMEAWNLSNISMHPTQSSWASYKYNYIIHILVNVINPSLCVFGMLGNILNVVIFTRRKRTSFVTHGEMEAVAYTGLIALAVSDMFYCTISLSDTMFADYGQILYEDSGKLPQLIFQFCSRYLQNIFTYTSTWLTVVMAINRYLAICQPINARAFMNRQILVGAIIAVFLAWVLLLIPELQTSNLEAMYANSTDPRTNQTVIKVYYVFTTSKLSKVYVLLYNALGFIVPVIIMILCNTRIVQALHRARRMRAECVYRSSSESQGNLSIPNRPLTYTLVLVVVMFLVLVSPSEIVWLVHSAIGEESIQCCHPEISLALYISNVMNTLNFATNFLLYCIVNVHFRKTLMSLVCRFRSQRTSTADTDVCIGTNDCRSIKNGDPETQQIILKNLRDKYA